MYLPTTLVCTKPLNTFQLLILHESPSDAEQIVQQLKAACPELQAHVVEETAELRQKLEQENIDAVISLDQPENLSLLDALQICRAWQPGLAFIALQLGEVPIPTDQLKQHGATDVLTGAALARLYARIRHLIDEKNTREADRQTNSKLLKSQQRYRVMAENAVDAIILLDQDGHINFCTPSVQEVLGRPQQEIVGQAIRPLIDLKDQNSLVHALKLVLTKQKPINLILRLALEEERWIDCHIKPIALEEDRLLIVCRDITDRKREEKRQLNEKLSQQLTLMNAVVEVQENERKRLSEELHDGIGPILSAVRMNISSTSMYDLTDTRDASLLSNAVKLLDDCLMELRNLAKNLIPPALNDYGLYRALRNFCEKNDKLRDIRVNYKIKEPGWNLSPVAEITGYRVSQELINNALKYSKAQNIFLEVGPIVRRGKDQLRIIVRDDGVGFDFSQSFQNEKGMGLRNIASRIHLLGGMFVVETSPGHGSTFVVDLPKASPS